MIVRDEIPDWGLTLKEMEIIRRDGADGYHRRDECPYPMNDQRRKEWWIGYISERIRQRLDHVFCLWRTEYP